MATKKTAKAIDVQGLTNDELISLIIRARQEAQHRGIEAEAEVWAASLSDDEATRIAQVAADQEAARLRAEEARRVAAEAAEQVRRDAAKAQRDAEAAKVAEAWADKERIAAKIREILGTEIEVPTDLKQPNLELGQAKKELEEYRRDHGKWGIKDRATRCGTEAEVRARATELGQDPDTAYQIDHSDKIESYEVRIAALEAKIAATPATIRKPQSYRLEVWSRGSDVRVYVARDRAKFGESLYDYYHTGTHKQAPRSTMAIYSEIDQAAKARGVTRAEIMGPLKELCADLATRYTTLKIEA